MKPGKSSISKAQTYEQIGDFWDTHDLADYWDQTKPVSFDVDIRSSSTYLAIDRSVSDRLRLLAAKRGVSAETLANLWLQEKMATEAKAS